MSTTSTAAATQTVSAEPLLRLMIGFEASQVLMTAHQLGVFKALDEKEESPKELCYRLGLPAESGERLLETCVAFHLLVWNGDRLKNAAVVETYLVSGKEHYLGGLVTYYQDIYKACIALPAAVRENKPQLRLDAGGTTDVFTAMKQKEALVVKFSQAMHSLGLQEGASLVSLYPFEKIRHLLDVGGGSGALAIALAGCFETLQVTILDQDAVCRLAESYTGAAGLGKRVQMVSADFWMDPWPTGHDAILLSMILHDWSLEKRVELLKRCWDALPSGGTLLIYEQLLNEDRCGPPLACLTNLTMLLRTHSGGESTEQEYRSLLEVCGFSHIAVARSPNLRHLIHAVKP